MQKSIIKKMTGRLRKNAIDKALKEVRDGKVLEYASLAELIKDM